MQTRNELFAVASGRANVVRTDASSVWLWLAALFLAAHGYLPDDKIAAIVERIPPREERC